MNALDPLLDEFEIYFVSVFDRVSEIRPDPCEIVPSHESGPDIAANVSNLPDSVTRTNNSTLCILSNCVLNVIESTVHFPFPSYFVIMIQPPF